MESLEGAQSPQHPLGNLISTHQQSLLQGRPVPQHPRVESPLPSCGKVPQPLPHRPCTKGLNLASGSSPRSSAQEMFDMPGPHHTLPCNTSSTGVKP